MAEATLGGTRHLYAHEMLQGASIRTGTLDVISGTVAGAGLVGIQPPMTFRQMPLARAPSTIQSSSAALLALVAGAALLVVEDPNPRHALAQVRIPDRESVGSVGALLTDFVAPRPWLARNEVEPQRGVLALPVAKRHLGSKAVLLSSLPRRQATLAIIGGREPEEDE